MRVAGNDRYAYCNGAAGSSDKSTMNKHRSNLRSILNICMVILAPDALQFKQRHESCSTKSTLMRDFRSAIGMPTRAVIRQAHRDGVRYGRLGCSGRRSRT